MANEDRAVRARLAATGELFDGHRPEMRAVHRRNGDRLAQLTTELAGWPGFRVVGRDNAVPPS